MAGHRALEGHTTRDPSPGRRPRLGEAGSQSEMTCIALARRAGPAVAGAAAFACVALLAQLAMPRSAEAADGDPFAFCRAVGTSERYDERWTGDDAPTALSAAPGYPAVNWRCVDGRLLICETGASGRHCMKMDSSRTPHDGIREYCRDPVSRAYPDVPSSRLGDSNSEWRCVRGRGVIVSTAPVDAQSYLVGAYRPLSPPSTPTAAARTRQVDVSVPTPESWRRDRRAHVCNLRADVRGVVARASPGGATVGVVPRGNLVLYDVRQERDGDIWLWLGRLDVSGDRLGWSRADFFFCEDWSH